MSRARTPAAWSCSVLLAAGLYGGPFAGQVAGQGTAPSQPSSQPTPQPAGQPPAQAQPPAQTQAQEIDKAELPDAKQILERYIEALGGREVVFGFTSRRIAARLNVYLAGQADPVQSGKLETWSKAPDIYIQDLLFPARGTTRICYDGQVGWQIDENDNAEAVTGTQLERLRDSSQFYQIADYDKLFSRYEVVRGLVAQNGQRVVQLAAQYHSGRQEVFTFDLDSGLLLAINGQREVEGVETLVDFQRALLDYKPFGAMQFPTRIIERYSNVATELLISSVEAGVEPPALQRPAGIEPASGG